MRQIKIILITFILLCLSYSIVCHILSIFKIDFSISIVDLVLGIAVLPLILLFFYFLKRSEKRIELKLIKKKYDEFSKRIKIIFFSLLIYTFLETAITQIIDFYFYVIKKDDTWNGFWIKSSGFIVIYFLFFCLLSIVEDIKVTKKNKRER